jgi:UDPglucose 6-dehydrogenase
MLVRMTVIGCGHLGATHAASMAEIGHEVIGVDIDPDKVATLNSGRAWFHEPGLDEMLARHLAAGRLRFTTDFSEAGAFGQVHFLGVATPGMVDRDDYDLSQIFAAVRSLAPHLSGPCVIVGKSTVSVGTTAAVRELVQELAPAGDQVDVAWNPEFLRE